MQLLLKMDGHWTTCQNTYYRMMETADVDCVHGGMVGVLEVRSARHTPWRTPAIQTNIDARLKRATWTRRWRCLQPTLGPCPVWRQSCIQHFHTILHTPACHLLYWRRAIHSNNFSCSLLCLCLQFKPCGHSKPCMQRPSATTCSITLIGMQAVHTR